MTDPKEDTIGLFNLAKAQLYYKAAGYRNIETPWLCGERAIRATLPENAMPFQVFPDELLVGSGEQGFIQMMLDGTLPPGQWQTTTPCFRDEAQYTHLTRKWFMKTELIWYMPDQLTQAFQNVLNHALKCMFEISCLDLFDVTQTPDGYDILCAGIELGSYGVRRMARHVWVYGTGLAEPRFSLALQMAARSE